VTHANIEQKITQKGPQIYSQDFMFDSFKKKVLQQSNKKTQMG